MRSVTAIAMLVVLLGVSTAFAAEPFLVQDGVSSYSVVLGKNASPSETRVAEELVAAVQECTGASLPVVKEPPAEGRPMIVLGLGPVAEQLGVKPTTDELGEQGYVARTVGPHLVIAGTPGAGTMYGVYDFLEECLGVRWHAPNVTKMPKAATIPLPSLDKTVRPAFAWRHTSYGWGGADEAFRVKHRDNNGDGDAAHPFGIQHAHDGRCHSYFRYVSPEEFFETHPEYFSEIGGVRRGEEPQLCLTNPEVLDIVTERMLKRMAETPGMRQHNFSQMDYYSYCQCDKCTAMNKEYGSLGGTQFWFVNQLAERTSKVYPDKLIGTLAYMYTEEPPKDLTMHPNVAVWLCHMFPSCQSHPIATCLRNGDYKRRAEAWSKICSHLYIWHYIVDFAHYYNPYPNFGAMAADMRFYHQIGAEGIYLQGMGPQGGEFGLLRPYYGMKLLWNPDQDADAIMRDFLEGYYGDAWEPIHEYITLLQNKVDSEDIHMHLYTNPAQGYLPDEVLARAMALFDDAEQRVKDDAELLERVRVARMPLTYARAFPRNGYEIKSNALVWKGEFAPFGELTEMVNRMKTHGFDTLREMMGPPEQMLQLGLLFSTPTAMTKIENERLLVQVVPYLGGRALTIVDKASGQCVTGLNIVKSLFFPFCGGEETRLGTYFMPQGMFSQFNVTKATPDSVTLVSDFSGVKVARVLTLRPGEPVLDIAAEMTNPSDKPVKVIPRSHTNLEPGELRNVRLAFTNRRGESIERDMPPILAGLREGEHYLDTDAPKGSWTFTGTKGLEITQRWDDADLDFAWVYAFPEDNHDLEVELWAKPVVIEPGATHTFAYSFEIGPMPK